MQTSSFIYFCTNIGNEDLLKKEVFIYYPSLKLSYSRPGFVTFKNEENIPMEKVSIWRMAFAHRYGQCFGRFSRDNILSEIEKHKKDLKKTVNNLCMQLVNYADDVDFSFLSELSSSAHRGDYVLDIIALKNDEFFLGHHLVCHKEVEFPFKAQEIVLESGIPSRAYYKIKELDETYKIFSAEDTVLELGSSPGGASFYMLEKDCHVYGVDPAQMDQSCLQHTHFHHLQKSAQAVDILDLENIKIDWIVCDMNLNPKQSIDECLRLYNLCQKTPLGIIVNLKMVKDYHAERVHKYRLDFANAGFHHIINTQVLAHKREYALVAFKA